ncbi:hypothetical protein GQ55_5G098100 [Panicum hallii var. hallii]|uniref:Uncharacterized protein n=1 Tax=Panicum hallii var. hallii TaxID=1504633 RepID=A0A2T7DEN5_9POAL|nr:hypothetical protein GQ55_5G098100 [Panicum hallii var. hallii]
MEPSHRRPPAACLAVLLHPFSQCPFSLVNRWSHKQISLLSSLFIENCHGVLVLAVAHAHLLWTASASTWWANGVTFSGLWKMGAFHHRKACFTMTHHYLNLVAGAAL